MEPPIELVWETCPACAGTGEVTAAAYDEIVAALEEFAARQIGEGGA